MLSGWAAASITVAIYVGPRLSMKNCSATVIGTLV